MRLDVLVAGQSFAAVERCRKSRLEFRFGTPVTELRAQVFREEGGCATRRTPARHMTVDRTPDRLEVLPKERLRKGTVRHRRVLQIGIQSAEQRGPGFRIGLTRPEATYLRFLEKIVSGEHLVGAL